MPHSWPLTGRDEEFGVIVELLESKEYQGVALAGSAGVGKSRLAREAAAAATNVGWSVRHVAATATGSSIPLGAFAQWTDDVEGAPLTLVHKVVGALTAGIDATRLLVVVDDAHLLDELSALVVHQLVLQRTATVIATIRSGQPAPAAVTALWKDGLLRRLELQPLSRAESDELLHHSLGLPPDLESADRLWRLTQGNVLFLRQLVEQEQRAGRLVDEDGWCTWFGSPDVSPSLIEVVEHQIGAIAESVRDVVDLVAVAEPVDRYCLMTLADPLAVEEAEQRELIRTSADAVYVGHPMYAEVRLKQCGALRLRRLRGLVASAMKDGSGTANSVRRGLLWLESDLPPDPRVLASAAAAASSLLDFALAERLSRAADESGVGVETRVHLAYNLLMLQRGEDADEVIDSIATDEVSPSAFIDVVILRAANLLWTRRSPEESWRVIDEALEEATGARRCKLLAFRANQLALAARPAEVVQVMACVDYEELDSFGTTIGLCAETLALGELGKHREAVAKASACYRVMDTSEQSAFLGQPLVEFHAFALIVSGCINEAVEVADEHMRRSMEKPASAQKLAAAIVGMTALAAGDLPTAVRQLPAESPAKADFVVANSFYRFAVLRAQVLARCGNVEEAEAALRAADAHRHPTYVYVESTRLLAEAWLAAARRRLSDARQLARRAADFARDHGQLAREVLCLQTAAQFDDVTVAGRLAELAAVVDGPRAPIALRYAQALGSDDAAELDRVSAAFESMGDLLAAADAAGQAATSHRLAGRSGSAMTAASHAGRLALACGGATSPAISAAGLVLPFTQREREIAVLVAQGLTNREIAKAVSLSVRTIEGHIYRASCKAGVTRRSSLADVMRNFSGRQHRS
jgi:DNA-binding CsgD family transcriptional regulator/MoxR-like ATPase